MTTGLLLIYATLPVPLLALYGIAVVRKTCSRFRPASKPALPMTQSVAAWMTLAASTTVYLYYIFRFKALNVETYEKHLRSTPANEIQTIIQDIVARRSKKIYGDLERLEEVCSKNGFEKYPRPKDFGASEAQSTVTKCPECQACPEVDLNALSAASSSSQELPKSVTSHE